MPAPKGNKIAEKWTIEEARKVFDEAWDLLERDYRLVTWTGISLRLGYYHDFLDYLVRKFDEFGPIKKSMLKIIEDRLATRAVFAESQVTGTIFVLKENHGWKDKVHNVNENKSLVEIDLKSLSKTQLKKVLKDNIDND